MTADDSSKTSKDGRSLRSTWPADARWADRMKPFRQRNLSPSERARLARAIRLSRRARWDATLVVRS